VVRLEIDTEKPGTAPFLEAFPIDVWPTLLVVDPRTEKAVLRWAGTATAAQVEALVRDGLRAVRAERAGEADAALARADALAAERRRGEAAQAYRAALAAGGRSWPGAARAAESLVQALALGGEAGPCAREAEARLPRLAPPAAAARVAAQGLGCALEAEPRDAALVAALERGAGALLGAKGVLADDRSWLFDALSSAREAAGDEAGARALARRWLAFLEAEAARAPTPAARSAFDGPRVSAALRLGEPRRALAAVKASERDLPGEFAPAGLRAVLHLELGEPAEALAAARRALARAEGPRRVRLHVLAARAYEALGDRGAARASLERAISEGAAMPEAVRPERQLRDARDRLARLGGEGG
jgi:tetratricopeptide (TPR) repeat protein